MRNIEKIQNLYNHSFRWNPNQMQKTKQSQKWSCTRPGDNTLFKINYPGKEQEEVGKLSRDIPCNFFFFLSLTTIRPMPYFWLHFYVKRQSSLHNGGKLFFKEYYHSGLSKPFFDYDGFFTVFQKYVWKYKKIVKHMGRLKPGTFW